MVIAAWTPPFCYGISLEIVLRLKVSVISAQENKTITEMYYILKAIIIVWLVAYVTVLYTLNHPRVWSEYTVHEPDKTG